MTYINKFMIQKLALVVVSAIFFVPCWADSSFEDIIKSEYIDKLRLLKKIGTERTDDSNEHSTQVLLWLLYDPSIAPLNPSPDLVNEDIWRVSLNVLRNRYPEFDAQAGNLRFDEIRRATFVRWWIESGREIPPEVVRAFRQREIELATANSRPIDPVDATTTGNSPSREGAENLSRPQSSYQPLVGKELDRFLAKANTPGRKARIWGWRVGIATGLLLLLGWLGWRLRSRRRLA